MGFSLSHTSSKTCKKFFNLFNNITNNTAIIIDTYGIHVKCSNKKFKIDSTLDEISFTTYNCKREYILALSIKHINRILTKHTDMDSIRILYSGQSNILFILNQSYRYSIPCTIIQNKTYITQLNTLDDLDYQVEFETTPNHMYTILKSSSKQKSEQKSEQKSKKYIHIHSNVENQCIYINDLCISKNKKIDLYHFVKNLNECYSNDYINQIVKNSIKQSVSTLLFGVYAQRSMKITAYIDEYNYIEYYISSLKTC